jgi:hypothetical protein
MLKRFPPLSGRQQTGDWDMSGDSWIALDGYEVVAVTDKALGLRLGSPQNRAELTWVPRSQVLFDGDIEVGDTAICVKAWLVEREGLRH